jgi:hypothetical protein
MRNVIDSLSQVHRLCDTLGLISEIQDARPGAAFVVFKEARANIDGAPRLV